MKTVPILKRLPRSNTDGITILEKRIKQVEGEQRRKRTRYHNLTNPKSDTKLDVLNEFMKQWKEKVLYLGDQKVIPYDITKYISAKDYIYIDKLYIKLQNRKANLTDDELIKYNKDCARLAENALIRIQWKNYI